MELMRNNVFSSTVECFMWKEELEDYRKRLIDEFKGKTNLLKREKGGFLN